MQKRQEIKAPLVGVLARYNPASFPEHALGRIHHLLDENEFTEDMLIAAAGAASLFRPLVERTPLTEDRYTWLLGLRFEFGDNVGCVILFPQPGDERSVAIHWLPETPNLWRGSFLSDFTTALDMAARGELTSVALLSDVG